jgi:hypothetical protein
MTRSHADWLPSADEQRPQGEALSSAPPRLVSGRARVETDGIEFAEGEEAAPVPASGRVLSEEEIAAAGIFQERVFEVAETREQAVVEKQVVVREEVVLRKSVAEHVETIEDSVRRTEVELEDLPAPDRQADAGAAAPGAHWKD